MTVVHIPLSLTVEDMIVIILGSTITESWGVRDIPFIPEMNSILSKIMLLRVFLTITDASAIPYSNLL